MKEKIKNDIYQGSFLSKELSLFHFSAFVIAIALFIMGSWKLGILFLIISFVSVVISYRLAGGRRNPTIWKNKDLYELLKYAATSGQAKIGLHALRSQKDLLNKLESIGIKMESSGDIRQFIRDKIVMDRRAFNILREDICIQIIHEGKEWFWDGYGNRKSAEQFHNSEIIFDLQSSLDHIFTPALEGLDAERNQSTALKGD